MKVLQVNSVFGYGSTGRIAADICKVLAAQGHEARVAYGRGAASQDQLRFASSLSVLAHVAGTRLLDLHGLMSRRVTGRLIREIEAWGPDLVHLHNIHGYYVNYPMLFEYLARKKLPIVWTLHDCWAFTGHCAHFDYIGCRRWLSGCGKCPQKGEYPSSWVADSSRHNYRCKETAFGLPPRLTLVTPSGWLGGLVGQSFLRNRRSLVIHNGIDTETFRPTDRAWRRSRGLESRFVLLGVASIWTERKGRNALLGLVESLPDDCVLVLVGKAREGLADLPRVIHVARTDSVAELAELYSSADVYVNPTLEDNFPTTNLEALACGTPVVTYRTGGSAESIDEATGIVVPKGDSEALREAVMAVRSRGRDAYSVACRDRACSKYAKGDRYGDYIRLYEESLYS